jgi:hypothetical protein
MSAPNHLHHRRHEEQLCVIFLDIDGVLLPFPPSDDTTHQPMKRLFPDNTLQAFDTLIQYTNAPHLVLSSTWRVREDFRKDILDCFASYGGMLSEYTKRGFWSWTNVELHSERQWEIQEWLQKHQSNYEKPIIWLALDDEELIQGDANARFRHMFEAHVVKPLSSVGLTKQDAEVGIKLWKAQQR